MNELDEPNAADGRGKTALAILHHPAETLGDNFESALREMGWRIERLDVFGTDGAPPSFEPPEVGKFDLTIALGGPMSANDPYPALAREMEFLAESARAVAFSAYALGRSCSLAHSAARSRRRAGISSGFGSCG